MTANVETLPVPSALVRRILAPATPSALVAASLALLKQRLLQPRLPRMSGEWMAHFERRASYRIE
jgi:hypothetical protein